MTIEPAFEAFAEAYAAGTPQVLYTRLIDDLETPVSAYLKVGHGRPYAFLFESVEGGAWRGRYSIVTLEPDLVWRCRGQDAEISEGEDLEAGRFRVGAVVFGPTSATSRARTSPFGGPKPRAAIQRAFDTAARELAISRRRNVPD